MKSKHRAGPPMTLGNVRRICLSIRAIAGLDQDQKTGSAGRHEADRGMKEGFIDALLQGDLQNRRGF